MSLSYLFPDRDYSHQLGLRKGNPREFFGFTAQRKEILRERQWWIEATREDCVQIMPDAGDLLDETLEIASTISNFPASESNRTKPSRELLLDLGRYWEPDFLILRPERDGELILKAGVVCFPSSWSLAEKIGRPLKDIHEVVPGLNTALGKQIGAFFSKLRPGTAWERQNWGMSRSSDLNQHPARKTPRLDEDAGLDEAWLRVEEQILLPLPNTGGVLFGIKISVHSLVEIREDSKAASGLARALVSMPEEMARYKNVQRVRGRLIELLDRPARPTG